MTPNQVKGHRQWPDGAFAPSETFSPNLPVPINGRPRIKRSGRGECPVPPRRTPSGLKVDGACPVRLELGLADAARAK